MLVYGEDLGDGRSIEFSALRLDQTDVEFPGYVFDIDFLVTDGYSVRYIDQHASFGDQQELDVWYNRTRLEGNSNSPAKLRLFPFLSPIAAAYRGTTDVDPCRLVTAKAGHGAPIPIRPRSRLDMICDLSNKS